MPKENMNFKQTNVDFMRKPVPVPPLANQRTAS